MDFVLSVEAYELVAHILTLGYAAMAAALLYFVLTIRSNAPRFRISSVLSVVVMTSALLLLYAQKQSWTEAFMFDGSMYVSNDSADLFTNGYRYLNWLIDVPMLLIQILFVATLASRARKSYMTQFFISGPLMIITGYVGQFYEPGRLAANVPAWLIWGAISTVFFIHVLVLITKVIREGSSGMDASGKGLFRKILPLFFIAWFLYPGAYLMPILLNWGVSFEFMIVAQQLTYTVADISSKIVYGVMLNVTSTRLSEVEGYQQAA